MTILIAKQNQSIITDVLPNIKFKESTKNTCTFTIKADTFHRLYSEVKLSGYNPFALMTW